MTNWNGDDEIEWIRLEAAKSLLRAATFFEATMQNRLNVSNPRPYLTPSRVGEYPRKRTGFGAANLTHEPIDLSEIARKQYVRVGFMENASYMLVLELFMGRLGLLKTLEDIAPQLSAFAVSGEMKG